jgi:uncharacterized protein (TIGR02266 family)
LSDGGLFVATYSLHPVGTELELRLELAELCTLELIGRVVWIRQGSEDAPPGMGIAFHRLSLEQREAITQFLHERPALFYDV